MVYNYGDVTGYKQYALDRNWPAATTAFDDSDILSALLVASEGLDNRYRSSFSGYPTGQRAQVRAWPRAGAWATAGGDLRPVYGSQYFTNGYAIPIDEIPDEILRATYEMARRELATPGALSKDFTLANSFRQVTVQGAVSVTYAGATSAADAQLVIPIVDGILQPILTGIGAVSGLSGRTVRV